MTPQHSLQVEVTAPMTEAQGEILSKDARNFVGKLEPLLGRGFLPEEGSPGAANVVMISDELWQTRSQGDPKIAGKSATIGAAPYTIVGVLPSGLDFPTQGIDIWVTRPVVKTALKPVGK